MITNEVRVVSDSGSVTLYEEEGEDFVEVRVFDLQSGEEVTVTINSNEFRRFVNSIYERFI